MLLLPLPALAGHLTVLPQALAAALQVGLHTSCALVGAAVEELAEQLEAVERDWCALADAAAQRPELAWPKASFGQAAKALAAEALVAARVHHSAQQAAWQRNQCLLGLLRLPEARLYCPPAQTMRVKL